jgi:hypothetical protein
MSYYQKGYETYFSRVEKGALDELTKSYERHMCTNTFTGLSFGC